MNKDSNCNKKEFLTCPVCNMALDKKHLGERCPRCNSIIIPRDCNTCKNICK